jgi:muconolactone delta-isomerase
MSNRFERRTARNTKAMVRLAQMAARRRDQMDAVALAELRATVRARIRELEAQNIPPRPDI